MPQPLAIFIEHSFRRRGFTLKTLPNRQERIEKIFDKYIELLNPRYTKENPAYIYLSWERFAEYRSRQKEEEKEELWELIVALDICSFQQEKNFELIDPNTSASLNPSALEQILYFTREQYARCFVIHFMHRGRAYKIVQHA